MSLIKYNELTKVSNHVSNMFLSRSDKNYYVNSVLLDPETLKETQKRFNSPMDRAMELIKDGNWVFIDKI